MRPAFLPHENLLKRAVKFEGQGHVTRPYKNICVGWCRLGSYSGLDRWTGERWKGVDSVKECMEWSELG